MSASMSARSFNGKIVARGGGPRCPRRAAAAARPACPGAAPAANEVSPVASMCRSVERELLMSSAFRGGLDAAGRNYLVSTGRFVLRGISRAQELYTLDPDIAADEVVAGKYERYLANQGVNPSVDAPRDASGF